MNMRQIHIFYNQAIIWHDIAPVCISEEICSICLQNCFCYCFWTIYSSCDLKLLRNNKKNNFALICCTFLVNLCKSSEILKQYDVKFWLNYRIYESVSYSYSCNLYFRKNRDLPDFSLLVKVAQKDIPANAVGTLGLQGCFWTKAVVSWHNTTIAKLQPKCHLGYYLHVFFHTIFVKLFHKPIVWLVHQH